MLSVQLLVLVGAASMSYAGTVRRSVRGAPELSGVIVDCANRFAVEYVSRTNTNFRCAMANEIPTVDIPGSFYEEEDCPPGQIYNLLNQRCENDPMARGFRAPVTRRENSWECPPGKLYVPAIDMCLEAIKPKRPLPLESDSLVVEKSLSEPVESQVTQFSTDCREGEIYNSELSLCLPFKKPSRSKSILPSRSLVKEPTNVRPLFTSSFDTILDCKKDETWISELGICIKSGKKPFLKSASLLKATKKTPEKVASAQDEEDIKIFSKGITSNDCADNEIFVSEIGICQPMNPSKNPKPLVADNQVKEILPKPAVATIDKVECAAGEIFVSELNMCLPSTGSKQSPKTPESLSLVKEPEHLELVSFAESASSGDCLPGQVYISEIGICA